MNMMRVRGALAPSLIGLIALAGCDTARQTGERGQIVFEYHGEEDYSNFNKPIIEGGTLDLYTYPIRPAEQEWPMQIERASTTHEEVLVVDGVVDHLVAVEARAPGFAWLEAVARRENGVLERDRVRLRVAEVREVGFYTESATILTGDEPEEGESLTRHLDALERALHRADALDQDEDDVPVTLTVTAGDRLRVPWVRYAANGEPLVGEGVFPVVIEPAGRGLVIDRAWSSADYLVLRASESIGSFVVAPAPGLEGEEFIVQVVAAPDEDSLGGQLALLERSWERGALDPRVGRSGRRGMLGLAPMALLLLVRLGRRRSRDGRGA